MSDGAGSDMIMVVKVMGVSSKALTKLHEWIKNLKPEKAYEDHRGPNEPIRPVSIIGSKLDMSYGTYTIELKITAKCGKAVLPAGVGGVTSAKFGEYFAPMTVLKELFAILSIGQQTQIFPEKELLAVNGEDQS